MNKFQLYIDADIEDTSLKNEGEWMAKITDAGHKYNVVEIFLKEGVALEEIGYKGKKLLTILQELCNVNDWPQTKFQFHIINLDQDKNVWPNTKFTEYPEHFLHGQKFKFAIQKDITNIFGMFVGRSSWDRLIIASHLFKNYPQQTMQTYRNYLDNPSTMLNIDLDRLLWKISSAKFGFGNTLSNVSNLIEHLPLLINEQHEGITHVQWNNGAWGKDLIQSYNKIFVDIVCEKTITGRTFFPTEKTGRPLATKTPFIIMSAPNYLKNLRRLGFKTFKNFWNESYDYQEGVERVVSIQKIIDNLANLNNNQASSLYNEMLPILEHNYNLYHELTSEKIYSVFLKI